MNTMHPLEYRKRSGRTQKMRMQSIRKHREDTGAIL